jgi:hypothetical protein
MTHRTSIFRRALRTLILTSAGLFMATTAQANCNFPANVEIPDGSTATEAELVATQGTVKQYMAAVETYLACLEEETNALGPDVTEDQIRVSDMKHNAAVDEMEKIASAFNAEIRAFNKKNSTD